VPEFPDGLSVCGFPWDDEWAWEVIGKWEEYIDGTNMLSCVTGLLSSISNCLLANNQWL
jgi:hypothetical protein